MIKLNLKKMVEENHKGRKEGRRMLSADGYYLNGFFGVKAGIDKTLDRMFNGATEEEGLYLEKLTKKCEYDVVGIEEKAIITKIDGAFTSCTGKIVKGTMYINSEYYRFIKKHKLEIKIHPESATVAGLKNGEVVAIFLGIRYGGTDTLAREMWAKEQTVEEFIALKEKEKAEKEQAKKMLEEYAEKTARELLVDIKVHSSQVMDIILNQGEGCRITKLDKKTYVLECKVEGEWLSFQRLDRASSKLSEQKLIGEKMLEILNSDLQSFVAEVDAEIKAKELEKANFEKDLEELEEVKKELVEFGVVHPAFKIGVYGNLDNGFRLEVEGMGHFLRLKTGYTLENVLKTMDGHKELIEGSREEIVEKIKSIIEPDVKEYQLYTKKVELAKKLIPSSRLLLEKREDGYRIIDFNVNTIYTINRGRLNHYRKLGRDCMIEYVVDKAKEVCPINLTEDSLTKKALDKKQMINVEEYFKKELEIVAEPAGQEFIEITEDVTAEELMEMANEVQKNKKEEVEQMMDVTNTTLNVGTVVTFNYEIYENDMLVENKTLTGKIVYVFDDFAGKYDVVTKEGIQCVVYNSDIIHYEVPEVDYEIPEIKKEIIFITDKVIFEGTTLNTANKKFEIKKYQNFVRCFMLDENGDRVKHLGADLKMDIHIDVYNNTVKEGNIITDITTMEVATDEEVATEKEIEVEEVKEIVTITKQQLTNKMKKLGKFLIDERTIEEKENKIYELFPDAMEVDVEENTIHFLAGEEYIGANPTRKHMLEENRYFGKINNVYGLAIYVSVNKNNIVFDANVAVDYSDKWGNREYMDYTVKELEVEIPMTIEKIACEMGELYKGVEEGSISLNTAQRGIDELMQTDVAQGTVVVMDALEKIAEYFKKLHFEEMEKQENERALDLIDRINKAYEEGRADKEQCLNKVLKEIKKASWASTRKLFKDIESKFTKKEVEVVVEKIDEPAENKRGSYMDCIECGSENFVENSKGEFRCHECGVKNTPQEDAPEEYIPDYRILTQSGKKAIDVVQIISEYSISPSGISGYKTIKFAKGFFYHSDIQDRVTKEQAKELMECGLDMDKQGEIAKRIVQEFNEKKDKENYEMLELRKVRILGTDRCRYDIMFIGMNINGEQTIIRDGEEVCRLVGVDEDRNIFISRNYEYLRPLVQKKLDEGDIE